MYYIIYYLFFSVFFFIPLIFSLQVKFEFIASSPDELTIKVGETVVINTEASGWYAGTNSRGESGLFPANYVELQ